jgi:hypothetical protein
MKYISGYITYEEKRSWKGRPDYKPWDNTEIYKDPEPQWDVIDTQHSRNIEHCRKERESLRLRLHVAPGFGVTRRLERLYREAGVEGGES